MICLIIYCIVFAVTHPVLPDNALAQQDSSPDIPALCCYRAAGEYSPTDTLQPPVSQAGALPLQQCCLVSGTPGGVAELFGVARADGDDGSCFWCWERSVRK